MSTNMKNTKDLRLVDQAAAELESARTEFASLGQSASASRAERALARLAAAEERWQRVNRAA
ncbi:MAG: hypothetical protein E7Z96_00860 [Actinomycetaceae bacterium]|jgi:hypothetical protein|nr:hypothetical protein [Actinomycetaceae bacterium]